NLAVQGHGRTYRKLYCLAIQHRKGARQPQTHRTNICIRWSTEGGRTSAKCLCLREKLDVHLESNHGFVARAHVRREQGGHGTNYKRSGAAACAIDPSVKSTV